ncbi:MAG: 3'-5' exonuclease [Candidatus Hatepunaea meridiana]|nr:3'-5' exonuclease [Candidatus Hatepunaea meridiana]
MLNPAQQQIINCIHDGLLVMASVGTGKTLALAERAGNAVSNGIDPDRILCLTFTNRAAKEMSERIRRKHPKHAKQMTISTFHGQCANMLRFESREIGIPSDFVVYDDVDSIELIQDIGRFDTRMARDIYYEIGNAKTNASGNLISAGGLLGELFGGLPDANASIAIEYQRCLLARHALDFQDLLVLVRAMLKENEDIRERWMGRYDLVQVDEVQDTHFSEYRVVRALAQRSGNLAMIGDFDQTIYEWRGSQPAKLIEVFKKDFAPVTALYLEENYRFTRCLLNAANTFAHSFSQQSAGCISGPEIEDGSPIEIHIEEDEESEGTRIAQIIFDKYESDPDFQFNRVGILTRTNHRGAVISRILGNLDIPHVTVEQYEYFRRQEIKDALAYLKILINPYDLSSLMRVLHRPSKGIGDVTEHTILSDGAKVGLHLTDMINPRTLKHGDPFGALLDAIESGSVVVFDVETTGLDKERDEIIEIAAQRLDRGQVTDDFHAYLSNTVPVGNSESVHGFSDAFLSKHGENAVEVLERFSEWCEERILVGHNVSFDVDMVRAHASRLGVEFPEMEWFDTLNMAHRFIPQKQYRLIDLAKSLNLSHLPTHKATDDVSCTVELLLALIPELRKDANKRRALVKKHGKPFWSLANQITDWRGRMTDFRPNELLSLIISESGLDDLYTDKPLRMENLEQLKRVFSFRDDSNLHPEVSLRELIKFTALAKNVDFLADTDNRVPIITVHQAKGLEFDIVFIAGAVDGEFPNYFAVRDNQLEEEKRVFYVALTRAKKHLHITGFKSNARGQSMRPSRFIQMMGEENLDGFNLSEDSGIHFSQEM